MPEESESKRGQDLTVEASPQTSSVLIPIARISTFCQKATNNQLSAGCNEIQQPCAAYNDNELPKSALSNRCEINGDCPENRDTTLDMRTARHEIAGPLCLVLGALHEAQKKLEEQFTTLPPEIAVLISQIQPMSHGAELKRTLENHFYIQSQKIGEALEALEVAFIGAMQINGVVRLMKSQNTSDAKEGVIADPEKNPNFVEIDFSEAVDTEVKLWRRHLRRGVRIEKVIRPGVKIRGNITHVQEILGNIFRNAIQVMELDETPERVITVTLTLLNLGGDAENQMKSIVQLMVQDNGPGIEEKDKDKIGEPGFSTKGGEGIGLSRSRKLAGSMGGALTLVDNVREREDLRAIYSLYGQELRGATAILELPVSHKKGTSVAG
jgi:signal transduction histidine kinase